MKDKSKLVKTIGLLGCIILGFIIFYIDASMGRPDYSVAIEGEYTEFNAPWILESVSKSVEQSSRSKNMEYSIASGIALWSENNKDIDATCRIADGMMYENKLNMKWR